MRFFTLVLIVSLVAGCDLLGLGPDDPGSSDPDPDSGGTVTDAFATNFPRLSARAGDTTWFGFSVAVSGDFAFVGAPYDSDEGNAAGAVYVFTRTADRWTEVEKLTARDGAAGDQFGYAVAISGDYAVVGAYGDDDNGTESGAAYLFERAGSTWREADKVVPVDAGEQDRFGWSVAISGDYAIIGAYEDDNNGTDSGSAFVFERSGDSLTEVAVLRPDEVEGLDRFGIAVAMYQDYAVIGASDDDDDGNNSGSAYVFERIGDEWTEVAKLRADDADVRDRFGRAVAVSSRFIVVGAYRDDDRGDASGSAYVFERSADRWIQVAKLTASNGAALDHFGRAVAVSGDYIIVGAYQVDGSSEDVGTAYLFERSGTSWREEGTLLSAAEVQGFGFSVNMSGDYAIVGAFDEDNQKNAAYLFEK